MGTETNSTVDGTTFELVRKGTAVGVPPAVRYDPHRKRAVLNPSEPLRTGATHVARLGVATSDQGWRRRVKDLADKRWQATRPGASRPAPDAEVEIRLLNIQPAPKRVPVSPRLRVPAHRAGV